MKKNKCNDSGVRGFTLIELLVVIGIIGLLTGLVTLNFSQARQRARDIQRKSELSNMQKALEMYKDDQMPQVYPVDGAAGLDLLRTGHYIKEVPIDPIEKSADGSWYDYGYDNTSAAGSLTYELTACLENSADPDRDLYPNAKADCGAGGAGAMYTLTQP